MRTVRPQDALVLAMRPQPRRVALGIHPTLQRVTTIGPQPLHRLALRVYESCFCKRDETLDEAARRLKGLRVIV